MTGANVKFRLLHRIHQQLRDLRERLERGPQTVKARQGNLVRLDQAMAKAKDDVKASRMAADQKELLLKTNESKIADLKIKLNVCKTNREYQAIKEQIEADTMACSVLADEIIEALEKVDLAKAQVPLAEQAFQQAKDELAKLQASMSAEHQQLEGEVARLETELREVEETLTPEVRDAYLRVVRGRGADALSPLVNQACGGCNHTVTTNMANDLHMGKMVFCKSCGRLLYEPEEKVFGPGKRRGKGEDD